jgi:hypothetical protein
MDKRIVSIWEALYDDDILAEDEAGTIYTMPLDDWYYHVIDSENPIQQANRMLQLGKWKEYTNE